MAGVSFLYVNITAFLIYLFLLSAFLAAKQSREIRSFEFLLAGFAIWSGSSILMRLEIVPGLNFWFYVCLLALFAQGLIIYLFVCTFAGRSQPRITLMWTVGTIVILILSACGIFLTPPEVVYENGQKLFVYHMTWTIAIPYVFLMILVWSIYRVFARLIRDKGSNIPGVRAIIVGCVVVGLGNILQILPGNTFPWDQFSGILFAIFLTYGLYKKRMFVMTLCVSKNVLQLFSLILGLIFLNSVVAPCRQLLAGVLPYSEDTITVILVFVFSLTIVALYYITSKLVENFFNLENQQEKLINNFSSSASHTLNSEEITGELIKYVKSGTSAERVFVCLKNDFGYGVSNDSLELGDKSFFISKNSPLIPALSESDGYLVLDEFKSTTLYKSMWTEEKNLLARNNVGYVSALKNENELLGMLFVSERDKKSFFSGNYVSYVQTLCSVASIAIKNASLYERMYREARIDTLTNVGNYNAFEESFASIFEKYGSECLALLCIDIDDFKLYNQLYGTLAGDVALKRIAEVIKSCVGEQGQIFRTSGKIFNVLLPMYDGRRAKVLTEEISRRVQLLNQEPGYEIYKALTISAGICVSPFSASSMRELKDNAHLACYSAKDAGNNHIVLSQESKQQASFDIRGHVNAIIANKDTVFESNVAVINALTAAIDAKDHYTCQHSNSVATYAAILAAAAGMGDDQIRMVYQAGMLHDIGKISIPETILSKQSMLSKEEYEIMKGHVNNSIDMIRHLPAMEHLIPAVLGHHERWDGKGYPLGSSGEEIPIAARCMAIADTFDAMTTDRPYRKALSVETAIKEIRKNAGSQFDPGLAFRFINLVEDGTITLNDEKTKNAE